MSQLFAWSGQSTGVSASASFLQRNPRADLQNGLVGSPCSPRDSQESSPTPQWQNSNWIPGVSDSVRPPRWQPTRSVVSGILQARTLEWVTISFSNAWKWKVKVKSLSHVRLVATPWTAAYQAPLSMGFSRQEYWSGVPLPSPKYLTILLKTV